MNQLINVIFGICIFIKGINSKSTELFFHLFITFIVEIFVSLINLVKKIKLIVLLQILLLILIMYLLRFGIFFELLLGFDEIVLVYLEHLVVSVLTIL